MPQKSSTFVQGTRDRETWLAGMAEREGLEEPEREQLLATAALVRGTIESIPVPEEAEERSRSRAVAELQWIMVNRSRQTEARAPWYLRLGHVMRFVFTFGRRR